MQYRLCCIVSHSPCCIVPHSLCSIDCVVLYSIDCAVLACVCNVILGKKEAECVDFVWTLCGLCFVVIKTCKYKLKETMFVSGIKLICK